MNKITGDKNMARINSAKLALAALIWGVAFVAQSVGGDAVGAYSFNCIRSFIGAAVLVPVILFLDKIGISSKPTTEEEKKTMWLGGISCGVVLCLSSNLQQLGINLGTPAGKAGFLTACYILLVPILGLFLKKKCGLNIWIGVVLALGGLYLLCGQGTSGSIFALSDILLLLCALGFSVHILVIDYFTVRTDGVRISCIQFLVSGILTAVPTFMVDMKHSVAGIKEWLPVLASWDAWITILYAGIMSCGVAYTLQIVGQKGINPTVASLILSLESVFSVIAGWVILGQTMGAKEIMGCVLIFMAITLAQAKS